MPAWCAALLIGHGGVLVAPVKRGAVSNYRGTSTELVQSSSTPASLRCMIPAIQTAEVVEEASGLQSG